MIICHCNLITKEQIDNAISSIEARGGNPTVRTVLKELDIKFKCGGCLGSYRSLIETKSKNNL